MSSDTPTPEAPSNAATSEPQTETPSPTVPEGCKLFVTPYDKHEVVFRTRLKGKDRRQIQAIYYGETSTETDIGEVTPGMDTSKIKPSVSIKQSGNVAALAQDKQMELCVVSINGKTAEEGIPIGGKTYKSVAEAVDEMDAVDVEALEVEINNSTTGLSKTEKKD